MTDRKCTSDLYRRHKNVSYNRYNSVRSDYTICWLFSFRRTRVFPLEVAGNVETFFLPRSYVFNWDRPPHGLFLFRGIPSRSRDRVARKPGSANLESPGENDPVGATPILSFRQLRACTILSPRLFLVRPISHERWNESEKRRTWSKYLRPSSENH